MHLPPLIHVMHFANRRDAGVQLGLRLRRYAHANAIVVALPRGGVPVGYEVARALHAPLDVLIARKIGAPGHEEFGIGALAEGGASYLDAELVERLGVTKQYLQQTAARELAEMERRAAAYRGAREPLRVEGRAVILVDDGLATGVTTRAAIRALRARRPASIVLAIPACSPETVRAIRAEVDAVVCVIEPEPFRSVGEWYGDFTQTRDDEVVRLLESARIEASERHTIPPP